MKKKPETADDDPLDREIDFSKARPNPYWLGMVDRRCVRLIAEDLIEIFPDNAAVDAALRAVADAGQRAVPRKISARQATAPPVAKKARS